jgi:hypothetical protein
MAGGAFQDLQAAGMNFRLTTVPGLEPAAGGRWERRLHGWPFPVPPVGIVPLRRAKIETKKIVVQFCRLTPEHIRITKP